MAGVARVYTGNGLVDLHVIGYTAQAKQGLVSCKTYEKTKSLGSYGFLLGDECAVTNSWGGFDGNVGVLQDSSLF